MHPLIPPPSPSTAPCQEIALFYSLDMEWSVQILINPLPDDKFLDWSNSKQIADDILNYI